ncbi:hypothetical protein SISSUDRAFT_1118398 [Sistotremastrum suecicum HHB10207 ss-3]|uniref:Uncharacterized protein n=1 Tax=Sistotremastrum suecicum HHB10207 ss-3 TaxID=1314776 RepID=A0A166F751_9AGAM|nr:hypothetical protein SISSUDRAFT_1118398 [Sistotremastrum suecicum HHB10207 ss-3]
MDVLSLFVTAFLSWRLAKRYLDERLAQSEATPRLRRYFKTALVFNALVWLDMWFLASSAIVWLEQLAFEAVGNLTPHRDLFEVLFFVALVGLPGWLYLSWRSITQERPYVIGAFLLIDVGLAVAWSSLFISPSAQFLFSTWPFFAAFSVISMVLLVSTLIMGAICWANFGRGLKQHFQMLNSISELTAALGYDQEEEQGRRPTSVSSQRSKPEVNMIQNEMPIPEQQTNS